MKLEGKEKRNEALEIGDAFSYNPIICWETRNKGRIIEWDSSENLSL